MRNELEQSQLIDRYLDGDMNAEEKAQFEQKMAQNEALRKEVASQQQLRESVFQYGIKKAAQKAFRKFKLYKKLFWGGAGVVVLAIVGVGFLFLNSNTQQDNSSENADAKSITRHNLGENYKDPNKHLESQFYNVKNGADTILETQNGMLVVLPNDGFVSASGEVVQGDITLEIKEAFDPASIMQSGLSTTSDGKMLETGGMFYIKAFQNGEELKINPDDPMVVDIPTQQKDKKMMLFDGEVQEDGSINWTDPKKFENWLTPVDILSLNFYPPNYLSQLEKLGQNARDKEFTDSLYYSFEGACDIKGVSDSTIKDPIGASYDSYNSWQNESEAVKEMYRNKAKSNPSFYLDTLGVDKKRSNQLNGFLLSAALLQYAQAAPAVAVANDTSEYEIPSSCGINPSKIKAIWQEKFNKTNLATKEFEQRIPTIHRSCENSVLDVYVNNLDQSLSYCDSLAARLAGGDVKKQLKAFVLRGDGRVQMNNRQAQRLANYFQRKQKQYSKILQKTQEEFWEQQRTLDQEAMQKRAQKTNDDIQRQQKMFQQELEENLDEAYRQLGKERGRITSGYVATVQNTGWKNVDQYVMESTVNRTTLNYKDPKTGKKAVIEYEKISLSIVKRDQFDEVFVYLIPNGLSSFNRADENESGFEYKLNELFQYDLMIVGMQEENIFTHRQSGIEARDYGVLSLSETSREQFNKMTGNYSWSGARSDLQQDMDYYLFNRKDDQRKARNKKRKDLRQKLMATVFPCYGGEFDEVVAPIHELESDE